MTDFDHILLIGFGGPEKPEDVKPFLAEVTRGIPIPAERLAEVEHHYEAIGGASPYNEYTRRLFAGIRASLDTRGVALPAFMGMRNWHPFMKDTMSEIKKRGLKKGIGMILAPHRSDASYEKYIRCVEDGKKAAGAEDIQYEYLPAWHDHPGFIKAQADKVREAAAQMSEMEKKSFFTIFSAHSIPSEMAGKCNYSGEFKISAGLVAIDTAIRDWDIAYQSRSGSPRQPWLEPEVTSLFEDIRRKEYRAVLIVPVGFLCDNAEVLYDLDIEAKQEAERTGLAYYRASTVMDHPKFADMFAELAQGMLAACGRF